MANLVSLFCLGLKILGKNQTGVFPISGFLVNSLYYPNSRTRDDIVMKLASVIKLDKRNKTTSKKLMMTSCQQTVTSFSFFEFMANLEPSRRRIPDAEFVKLTFPLQVTVSRTNTESRTKKSLAQISHYCFK